MSRENLKNFKNYKSDFPLLTEGKWADCAYLDSAATSQKPAAVIDAVDNYYRSLNANIHRGLYGLSVESTQLYERAKESVRQFINAKSTDEVVFTKSTTEAINAVAYTFVLNFLGKDDEIALPVSEHHSNFVPWQQLAKRVGAKLTILYPDSQGYYSDAEIASKITPRVKLFAFAKVSNVLGTELPTAKFIKAAKQAGAKTLMDCAQSIGHMSLDVQAEDVDFAVFSGHKMFAPMGIGVLYGKQAELNKLPPFLYGGDMIEYVYENDTTFAPLPLKFEGGTANAEAAAGMIAAVDYIKRVGYGEIERIGNELCVYAQKRLSELPYITIYGTADASKRRGLISFNVDDVHPHDVASILDSEKVAIRAGHHCAQPLHRFWGINATCRASFYVYNSFEDVDRLIEGLKKVRRVFGYAD